VAERVLVVDDDASFREAICELLQARGLQIVGNAADEVQAVEAVRTLDPDGVLLDVNLASSDGFEVIKRLSGLNPNISVLLTSSDPDAVSDDLARELGAVGFVPKTQLATTDLRRYFAG
jgi:DNA-binding NarL/FixJ family response regulator